MVARFAMLTALVALAAWAAAALLRWRWSVWVRADQELVLARQNPSDTVWASWALIGIGMVISLLVLLAWQLAHGSESRARELLAARWDDLLTGCLSDVYRRLLRSMGIALWRRPQPDQRPSQQTPP